MGENVFKKSPESYKMMIDPVRQYKEQSVNYLMKSTGKSKTECADILSKILKKSDTKNPTVRYLEMQDNGDRIKAEMPLYNYITSAIKEKLVIAPSLTCYLPPNVKKSLHVEFIADNVKSRSKAKKEAFNHKAKGEMEAFILKDVLQKTKKIFNNSLSGAYASKSTILFHPSSHYTLTSITRLVASIGNAISEVMIAGNRLYTTPDIVISNIMAMVTAVDKVEVAVTMKKFDIHIPSVEECMKMVLYSTRLYWANEDREKEIYTLLSRLTPIERAIVLYTNDMYQLRLYNSDLLMNVISSIGVKGQGESADPYADLNNTDEYIINLAHLICSDDIKGMRVDYKELQGTELLSTIAKTANGVSDGLHKYKDLIQTFLATPIAPVDISHLPDMLRRVIVLSDTDSTCATYQDWTHWYFGKTVFGPEATAISATVMTFVTQAIDHHLKMFSSNMNVTPEAAELLSMKNEFGWHTFSPLNVSKHYYADPFVQEGVVFKEPDLELKGVNLIASKIPKKYQKQSQAMMIRIMDTVYNNKKIKLTEYIKEVADIERDILEAVRLGDIEILKLDKIKEAEAYKLGAERSPYLHHMLWTDVFSAKYGIADNPPYMAIKLPTKLNSKRKLNVWLDTIIDSDIKAKMTEFVNKHEKEAIGTFRLPLVLIGTNGIPEELVTAIDTHRIVKDICAPFYLILETLGYYKKEDRMLSEEGY